MTLRKWNGQWFGDNHADLRKDVADYAQKAGYPIDHFVDVTCSCGNAQFSLEIDEEQGVAIRKCTKCYLIHPMGDSPEYLDDADPYGAVCVCDERIFEVSVGVSLYADSDDVRWLYLGCRCVNCGMLGCYAEWKNEYIGYQKLLDKM